MDKIVILSNSAVYELSLANDIVNDFDKATLLINFVENSDINNIRNNFENNIKLDYLKYNKKALYQE